MTSEGVLMRHRVRRHPVPGFGPEQMLAVRTRLGISQVELAEAAGIEVRSYASWERGEVVPTAAKIGPLVRWLQEQGIDPYRYGERSIVDPLEQIVQDHPLLSASDKDEIIGILRRNRTRRLPKQ